MPNGGITLPDVARAKAVASGQSAYMSTVEVNGTAFRMYTFPLYGAEYDGQQMAVELARPIQPTENVLSTLRLVLALVFLAGVGLAAGLGRLAARRVLLPLAEVTATAQLIG